MKQCSLCEETKPLSEYGKRMNGKNGLDARCKVCRNAKATEYRLSNPNYNAKSKEWREANPDKVKWSNIKHQYNMTQEQYEQMLRDQDYACGICKRTDVSFHIDHDHSCCPQAGRSCGGCIRGLLCQHCNHGLGKFRDSRDNLASAINWLDRGRAG